MTMVGLDPSMKHIKPIFAETFLRLWPCSTPFQMCAAIRERDRNHLLRPSGHPRVPVPFPSGGARAQS